MPAEENENAAAVRPAQEFYLLEEFIHTVMMHYYVYSSQFRENKYPVYCIANQNPELEDDWNDKSCRKFLIGNFKTYADAIKKLKESVSDFSEYEELDDSAIHGETVFVHK